MISSGRQSISNRNIVVNFKTIQVTKDSGKISEAHSDVYFEKPSSAKPLHSKGSSLKSNNKFGVSQRQETESVDSLIGNKSFPEFMHTSTHPIKTDYHDFAML